MRSSRFPSSSSLPPGGQSLSPEVRLLLCTAGGPEADDAIRNFLPRVTSWPRLLELSIAEGTHPVFGSRLRAAVPGGIPDDVGRTLDYIERTAAFRQRYLQNRMVDALRLLSTEGIPVVLLKGAALAHTTYGSFVDRPMSDIDLLVRPNQADSAQAALRDAGWAQHYDPEFDGFYETMHHLPPLIDARAPKLTVGLEIHTAIVQRDRDPFAFAPDLIWEAALPAEGHPPGTLVPTVVHRLFHCCLHFAWSHKLGKGAWRTFRDISAMIRVEPIDWTEFVATARSSGGATACYWALYLARSLANAPVPGDVLRELVPRRPALVLSFFARHFSHTVTAGERICPSERLQDAIWMSAFRPGPGRDGMEPEWRGVDRQWLRMRGAKGDEPASIRRRPAMSPAAWLRYVGSIAGIRAGSRIAI